MKPSTEPAPAAPVWAISDGAAGNVRQVEALAGAIGLPFVSLRTETRAPWRWLAPRGLAGARHAFGPEGAARLAGPLPRLAIGCGRQAALMTRLLGRLGQGHCRSVQILDPRLDSAHWDVVVAPRHDALRGANVIVTRGSLHPVDAVWLTQARARFPTLGTLPSPRLALLLGGPVRGLALDAGWWEAVATAAERWLDGEGGSLLLLGSRRTPEALAALARKRFAARAACCWFGPEDDENPYSGALAWADRVLVSPDSVNMLSEACALGVPVLTHAPILPSGRLGAFLRGLLDEDRVRPLARASEPWTAPPLRELPGVAAEVRRRLGL